MYILILTCYLIEYLMHLFLNAVHFVMLGIQRMFGPSSSEMRTKPAKLVSQNGHMNGNVYKHTTYFSSMMRLHAKLMNKIQGLYNFVFLQANYCKGTSLI